MLVSDPVEFKTHTPPQDFRSLAPLLAQQALAGLGTPVHVRDIERGGKLVETVWKAGGIEVIVKNLHPEEET